MIGYKLNFVELHAEIVDGFLDQVSVFIRLGAELGIGHTDEQDIVLRVAELGWLEPGVVRVPVDFLFQRVEDAGPGIRRDGRSRNRHKQKTSLAPLQGERPELCFLKMVHSGLYQRRFWRTTLRTCWVPGFFWVTATDVYKLCEY